MSFLVLCHYDSESGDIAFQHTQLVCVTLGIEEVLFCHGGIHHCTKKTGDVILDPKIPWHALEIQEVFERLETSKKGLTNEEAERRLAEYGTNKIQEEEEISKAALLINQLRNPLIGVLVVAALVSLAAGKSIDALVITIIIGVNSVIGFSQEYKAETAIQSLKSMAAPKAEVIRECRDDGKCIQISINSKELVPGDLVLLNKGDKVPADIRLYDSMNLETDESLLTGESTPVEKGVGVIEEDLSIADRKNMVFSGTLVTHGRAKGIVVSTGMETEMGRIAELVRETDESETPIQKRINSLSRYLGVLVILVAGLTLLIGILRLLNFNDILAYSLASAVSSIPEGLPAVTTVALTIGVRRMAKRNAIIRKLRAVDTLGSASAICADKTGTLTTNQMTVRKILSDNRIVGVTGVGYTREGHFEVGNEPIDHGENRALTLLLKIATLCNDARLSQEESNERNRFTIQGEPTEGALLIAARKAGLEKHELENDYPRVDEIPFTSKYRYMATFHESSGESIRAFVKGGPEDVLRMCSHFFEDGKVQELTPEKRRRIREENTQMASEALRVLAFAHQTTERESVEDFKERIQYGNPELIFVGLVGMIDPPRPMAKDAVKQCKDAGIKVIMATGDHHLTAEAIAREVGILEHGSKVITGSELDKMSEEELDAVVDETSVFARVSPGSKYRIVESLERRGHIVAMTGDGVNDAPALKAAEIGIAMGITGTDVTRETADMVLTDDNFASIVSAVEEGRVVFKNIQKVVKYLLSTNIGEDLIILVALILLPATPLILAPIQILWVNLVTDGILDVTLAMEPKEDDVMKEPPRDPTTNIVNGEILLNILYASVFMVIGTLWVFAEGYATGGLIRAQTLGFTTLAMFQVFNSLNCRSRTKSFFSLGLLTNKYLYIAIMTSVLLLVLTTILPFFQAVLGTTALSMWDWMVIISVSSSIFFADEIRKFVQEQMKKRTM